MNPETAVYLGTFAAFSFMLKVAILFNVRIKSKIAESFVILCLVFVVQSAAEFLAYFTYLRSVAIGEFMINLYMISLFFIFPSTLQLAFALTNSRHLSLVRILGFSTATLVSIAYASGLVVADFRFVGWSVITEPGRFYWSVMAIMMGFCLLTLVHLLHQLRSNADLAVRHNARVNLLALSPIAVVALAVLGLRLAGFNSSTAVSLPIATLLFLYAMLLHTNGNLFWLSTKLKTVLVLLKTDHQAPIQVILQEVEKVRIQEALKMTDGQQKLAAEILGVPASTLNKRLTKYNINVESFR
jgi:hypothetical protein